MKTKADLQAFIRSLVTPVVPTHELMQKFEQIDDSLFFTGQGPMDGLFSRNQSSVDSDSGSLAGSVYGSFSRNNAPLAGSGYESFSSNSSNSAAEVYEDFIAMRASRKRWLTFFAVLSKSLHAAGMVASVMAINRASAEEDDLSAVTKWLIINSLSAATIVVVSGLALAGNKMYRRCRAIRPIKKQIADIAISLFTGIVAALPMVQVVLKSEDLLLARQNDFLDDMATIVVYGSALGWAGDATATLIQWITSFTCYRIFNERVMFMPEGEGQVARNTVPLWLNPRAVNKRVLDYVFPPIEYFLKSLPKTLLDNGAMSALVMYGQYSDGFNLFSGLNDLSNVGIVTCIVMYLMIAAACSVGNATYHMMAALLKLICKGLSKAYRQCARGGSGPLFEGWEAQGGV